MNPRFAVLVDGGFFTKALAKKDKAFPTAERVRDECLRLASLPDFQGHDLLRIYFYDAPPVSKKLKNPVDGIEVDLGSTDIFRRHTTLLESIEQFDDFALRKGETVARGWNLGARATKAGRAGTHRLKEHET